MMIENKNKNKNFIFGICLNIFNYLNNLNITPFKYQFKLFDFNFKLITHSIICQ